MISGHDSSSIASPATIAVRIALHMDQLTNKKKVGIVSAYRLVVSAC